MVQAPGSGIPRVGPKFEGDYTSADYQEQVDLQAVEGEVLKCRLGPEGVEG